MSEEKRYVPVSPKGKDQSLLSADTRTQAIANIKAANPSESRLHWKELQEQGWVVLDTDSPVQQQLY